ncbi:MAG TPA: glycosyltransferase family 1 protein [Thermosynechococcus sp. M98_K2018_005]|nr:glycosyltransferase family 1 protein [Thermosynechococcus sp. M98_K2018_005]
MQALSTRTAKSALPRAFAMPQPQVPARQPIALISVHGDPAADVGHESAGGQNIYVRQLGEALAAAGWHVDMFTRKIHPDDPDVIEHSPHCRTIRLQAGPLTYIPREKLFETLPKFVAAFKAYHAKYGYPLIHTNYWLSGWVGWQLRQELNFQWLHTYHSLGVVKYQVASEQAQRDETRLMVEKAILENADCVIVTSPQEEAYLRRWVSKAGQTRLIPCGTNLNLFYPVANARAQLNLPADEPIVLYVGRFDPRKGIETLVAAMAQLPQGLLLLVGGSDPQRSDGAERRRIEGLVQEYHLGDRVTFVGQIDHERLAVYYSAANVCVVPSYYEPFGLVAIEAMACGTPVIASAVGGLQFTVIPEETGLLVPPQDATALAKAIQRILADPAWARTLGENGRERVQALFNWEAIALQMGQLYRQLFAASLMGNSPRLETVKNTASLTTVTKAALVAS